MAIFNGQTALVTGGPGGIGRAICLVLARRGASVTIGYHSGEAAAKETQHLANEAAPDGVEAHVVQADVTDEAQVKAMVDGVVERAGSIDIMVNNAGMLLDKPLAFMKYADWQTALRVNLDSAFLCTRAVVRPMMRHRRGCIVNIGSIAGSIGAANRSNYSAAKAGLIGLTKSAARELAQFGVRVNAVCPGLVETEMIADMKEAARVQAVARTPLGRLGHPDDIAEAVVFLASPLAGYLTGECITVDGGYSL